jgi:hypothetical protein
MKSFLLILNLVTSVDLQPVLLQVNLLQYPFLHTKKPNYYKLDLVNLHYFEFLLFLDILHKSHEMLSDDL